MPASPVLATEPGSSLSSTECPAKLSSPPYRFGKGDAVSEWEVQSLSASIVYVDSEAFFKVSSGLELFENGPLEPPSNTANIVDSEAFFKASADEWRLS